MSIVLAVISTERETKVGLFANPHTHTQMIGVFNQSCGCQSWKLNIQPCTNIDVSNSTHHKRKKKKNKKI